MTKRNRIKWHAVAGAIVLTIADIAWTHADEGEVPRLVGRVIKVVDGDTLDIRLESGPLRIRLHAADTPERGQPYYEEARAALSKLVLDKVVEVEPFEQDRYDRMVGILYLKDLNINAELIQAGHAWAFRRYMRKEDARLCQMENDARRGKRGLWSLKVSEQVAPWEYRSRRSRKTFTNFSRHTAHECIAAIGSRY